LEGEQDRIGGFLEYSSDLFEHATALRLFGHFEQLLRGCLADPDRDVREVPLMGTAERSRVLLEWNQTARAYPRDSGLAAEFEGQVARTPEAEAVVFDDMRLTYRALNARTNRLARHLRRLGVGPETRVGLCVEGTLDLVTGMLGILKAGGAYVPLRPRYSPARAGLLPW